MKDRTIRVVIADDHAVVREGLSAFLQTHGGFAIVGAARDGYGALKTARDNDAEVVVMDIGLPGLDGIGATKQIKTVCPNTRVLILSMHDDADTVRRALEAGAVGYVLKGTKLALLAEAIYDVHRGGIFLDPGLSEVVTQSHRCADGGSVLSEREREVLKLVAEGYTGREIAVVLGISPKTVEKHRANLLEKLNIRTTAGLVRFAVKSGIVS